MKKFNVIIAAVAIMAALSGCCNKQPQGPTVISLDNIQVMYAGVDNPITVASTGISSDMLTVSIDDTTSTITAGETAGSYIINPSGKAKNITVAILNNTDTVGAYRYKVCYMPDPQLIIGVHQNGSPCASRKDFTNGDIYVIPQKEPTFDFKVPKGTYVVNSFDITVGNKQFANIDGNKFTPDIQYAIKNAKRGDYLSVIAHVAVSDSTVREIPWKVKLNE